MNEVVQVLTGARALIERGWCQGHFMEHFPDGPHYCAVGAIATALEVSDTQFGIRGFVYDSGVKQLAETVGEGCVPRWNDALWRTKAEVLAAFDETIARLQGTTLVVESDPLRDEEADLEATLAEMRVLEPV